MHTVTTAPDMLTRQIPPTNSPLAVYDELGSRLGCITGRLLMLGRRAENFSSLLPELRIPVQILLLPALLISPSSFDGLPANLDGFARPYELVANAFEAFPYDIKQGHSLLKARAAITRRPLAYGCLADAQLVGQLRLRERRDLDHVPYPLVDALSLNVDRK